MIKEIFEKIKRDKWTIQSGHFLAPLILIIGAMIIVMTLFELGKDLFFPYLSMWEDDAITIVYSAVAAFIIGYFVMKKIQRLYQQAVKEITERKRVEEELSKSQKMLEKITQGITENILLISKDFRILWANKAAMEAHGSGIVGDYCYKATHQSESRCEPPLNPCPLSDLPKEGESLTLNHIHYDKQGNKRHVEVDVYPVMDEKGEVLQFIHVCRDITERKRVEEARRESEERYRSILDNIEEGYFEVDLAGNFTFFNDSLCRKLGYSQEEMMGMNNRQYMDKETAKAVYQAFNRVYTTGESYKAYDWGIIRKDGTERIHESSVSLLKNAQGERIGFRGVARDVTEKKQIEEEREKLVGELQKTLSEVKTLKGILPICASCKKIRDDKGYWNQVESYVRDHTEAEFTHGVCPECMKKLYPEFFKEERNKTIGG